MRLYRCAQFSLDILFDSVRVVYTHYSLHIIKKVPFPSQESRNRIKDLPVAELYCFLLGWDISVNLLCDAFERSSTKFMESLRIIERNLLQCPPLTFACCHGGLFDCGHRVETDNVTTPRGVRLREQGHGNCPSSVLNRLAVALEQCVGCPTGGN